MKQEDKDLLLNDLCSRLPYGVKMQKCTEQNVVVDLYAINLNNYTIDFYTYKGKSLTIANTSKLGSGILLYKPYLFPMSSMTSEHLHEIQSILGNDCKIENDFIRIVNSERNTLSYQEIKAVFNYCYKNHLDINGLIPRGLGIDATGLGIY